MAAPTAPKRTDVVVVGAGCIGASVAFHLAGRGLGVVLLDKRHIASGATGHSGALVRQHYEARLGVRLARESLEFFQRFAAETGFSCDFRTTGFLSGARTRDIPAFDAMLGLLQQEGVRAVRLTPAEARSVEPVTRCRRLRGPRLRPGRGLRGPDRDGDRVGARLGASRGDRPRGMRGAVHRHEAQDRHGRPDLWRRAD